MAEYIEREALIDFVKNNTATNNGWTTLKCVEMVLRYAPTADVVEVRHGEWKDNYGESQCSACGFSCGDDYYLGQGLFCPECGTKMKKPLREGTP